MKTVFITICVSFFATALIPPSSSTTESGVYLDPGLNLSVALDPLHFALASNGGNSRKLAPMEVFTDLVPKTMILNGVEATIGMFPFMASVQVLWSDGRIYHICGGSLVAPDKVVTAAHCMVYWNTYEHFVALGVQSISQGGEALVKVESISIHPDYDPIARDFPNDVCVLSLEENVTLSTNIQPVPMATFKDPNFDNMDECEVMGWGKTGEGTLPDTLRYAVLKGISNNECRKFMRVFRYRGLQQYHKCAWNWPHAACEGDSGGPLVCQGLLMGVSSWGVQGCTGCFPSVFSRVPYHQKWILEQ